MSNGKRKGKASFLGILIFLIGLCGAVMTSTLASSLHPVQPFNPGDLPENPGPPTTEVPQENQPVILPIEQVKMFLGALDHIGYFQTTVKVDGVPYQTCTTANQYVTIQKGNHVFEAPYCIHISGTVIINGYPVNGAYLYFSNFIYWFPPEGGPATAEGQPGSYNYWIGNNDDPAYAGMGREVVANEAANTVTITLEVKQGWNVGVQYYPRNPSLSIIGIPFGEQTLQVDSVWLVVMVVGVVLAAFAHGSGKSS